MGYTVAVRSLCEFTAKHGDLDLRFTPSPTAQDGIAGHKLVTARRADSYQREVTLSGDAGELHVRGRADGYDPEANRLEEIKTHRGDLARMPENHRQLHWAQAKVYACLLCRQRGLPGIDVALVYFEIASQEETVLTLTFTAAALEVFFLGQCALFLAWARHEMQHRTARDAGLVTLPFAHGEFRSGQRVLAEAVYRAASGGRCLMAQAPTGIGKTIGTLFPALKAMPAQKLDKLYFLTAKTSGRQVALDALRRIRRDAGVPLRVVEIVARDSACEYPQQTCHGDGCPLARGFYDRLPAARAEAFALPAPDGDQAGAPGDVALLDRQTVRTIALTHQVCPYYLTQELTRWSDVAIADYNYYFDMAAMLHALTLSNDWRVTVLVDEAHNLLERARKMYSATLAQSALRQAQHLAPPALSASLAELAGAWQEIAVPASASYSVLSAIPAPFKTALQAMLAAAGDYLAENRAPQPDLLAFFFDALHFSRLTDSFDTHSLFDIHCQAPAATVAGGAPPCPATGERTLAIRNIVPAPFLKNRFTAARSVTLFSATLSPQDFYRNTLGVPDQTVWIDVPSPFLAHQLSVQVVERISTRFSDRRRSLPPIAALMARQFAQQPGNYLAFFSSFDYLQKVADVLMQHSPQIPVWVQSPRMDDAARNAFLARFATGGTGIGFAVLGGSFAEGIDLPGERLIGAFIATLGLPQVNPVNEQVMQRMELMFGAGYDYAYLYPGLQKVVQAAGRVIRSQTDRGVVYLIDDRFSRPQVRALLPAWWEIRREQPSPGVATAGPGRAPGDTTDWRDAAVLA